MVSRCGVGSLVKLFIPGSMNNGVKYVWVGTLSRCWIQDRVWPRARGATDWGPAETGAHIRYVLCIGQSRKRKEKAHLWSIAQLGGDVSFLSIELNHARRNSSVVSRPRLARLVRPEIPTTYFPNHPGSPRVGDGGTAAREYEFGEIKINQGLRSTGISD
jgi:hypothetical protein